MSARFALLAPLLWSLTALAGGISARPMVIDKAITPTDNTVEFVLTNQSHSEVQFTLSAGPAQHDVKGTPIEGQPGYRYDLSPHIRLPSDTIRLGGRRWRRIRAQIEIPPDQTAGYAFIYARAAPEPGQRGGVSATLAVGILVEVSFPGAKPEGLRIAGLRVEGGALRAEIRNHGPVHVKPTGSVQIESLDGTQLWSGQLEPANVFPELSRELKVSGPPLDLPPGQHRARISVTGPVTASAEVLIASAEGQVLIHKASPAPP